MPARLAVVVALLAVAARAADPLPPGAVARFGDPDAAWPDDDRVTVSPDGTKACCRSQTSARVIDLATGKEIVRMSVPLGGNTESGFDRAGRVYVAHADNIRYYDPNTGKEVAVVTGLEPDEPGWGSPCGRWYLRPRPRPGDGKLYDAELYDLTVRPAALARVLGPPGPAVEAAGFNESGSLVAVAPGNIRLYDTATGELRRTLSIDREPGKHTKVHGVAVSPDGRRVAASLDSANAIWELNGPAKWRLELDGGNCTDLFFHPDGRTLFGNDTEVQMVAWDTVSGATRVVVPATKEEKVGLRPSRDGGRVQFSPADRRLDRIVRTDTREVVWEARRAAPLDRILRVGRDAVWARAGDGVVAFARADGSPRPAPVRVPDGVRVEAVAADGQVWAGVKGTTDADREAAAYDAAGAKRGVLPGTQPLLFTADGRYLIDDAPKLIDVRAKAVVEGPGGRHVRLTPDERFAVSVFDKRLDVFELATRKSRRTIDWSGFWSEKDPIALAVTDRLAAVAVGSEFLVLDLYAGRSRGVGRPSAGGGKIQVLAVSADGRWLAHAGPADQAAVAVHDLSAAGPYDTARPAHLLVGHCDDVNDLAFTPDGRHLVSASADGTALVWDVATMPKPPPVATPEVPAAALWDRLALADAERADEAVTALLARPAAAVAVIRDRLKPADPVPAEKVAALVAKLDAAAFADRAAAEKELAGYGDRVVGAVRSAAEKATSAEARERLTRLADRLGEPITDPAAVRSARAIEVLERIGTADAKAVLKAVAGGAADARRTADAKAALGRLGG